VDTEIAPRTATSLPVSPTKVRTRAAMEEVIPALKKAMADPGPFLINFVVEAEENVYPMVPPGAALHEVMEEPSNREVESWPKNTP